MPVRRNPPERGHQRPGLVNQLEKELKKPQPEGTPGAPLIIEDEQRGTGNLHVHVIWDAWEDVLPTERGAIILHAYERARGKDIVLKIHVAMGVTPTEAQHLGIS